MKVFISWSGAVSHKVALVLRDWITVLLPYTEAWVSSEDIAKGVRWGAKLASELETTNCGIICITSDNIQEPWLNFEAGALSKTVDDAQVHPLLLGMSADDVTGPLSQFQASQFTRDDMLKLVRAVNGGAGANQLSRERVDRNFNACWAGLLEKVSPILAQLSTKVAEDVKSTATQQPKQLDADKEKILIKLAENGQLSTGAVSRLCEMGLERARFHLEELFDAEYITSTIYMGQGAVYQIDQPGRRYLMDKGLLR